MNLWENRRLAFSASSCTWRNRCPVRQSAEIPDAAALEILGVTRLPETWSTLPPQQELTQFFGRPVSRSAALWSLPYVPSFLGECPESRPSRLPPHRLCRSGPLHVDRRLFG